LNDEKRVAGRLLLNEFRQRSSTSALTMKRVCDQLLQVVTSQRGKHDVMHDRASLSNGFQLAHQRMSGGHFVIAVGPDQHHMFHVRIREQIFHQI
jgi:hypothetical protein